MHFLFDWGVAILVAGVFIIVMVLATSRPAHHHHQPETPCPTFETPERGAMCERQVTDV